VANPDVPRRLGVDPLVMEQSATPTLTLNQAHATLTLNQAQALFAQEHGAHPGLDSLGEQEGMVFLYREEPWATYRWLVDRQGEVADLERFFKS